MACRVLGPNVDCLSACKLEIRIPLDCSTVQLAFPPEGEGRQQEDFQFELTCQCFEDVRGSTGGCSSDAIAREVL